MRNVSLVLFLFFVVSVVACKEDAPTQVSCDFTSINDMTAVKGYEILEKLPGIWNGPVNSSTPLGSYPEWIVDFRPISPAHVSAKNELDRQNDIFMSFFIVKHACEAKVAFRNGGGFAGLQRNAYMLIDSVFENTSMSYFRFADPISGGNRVYSDVIFKADSLIIEVYTNKYNTLSDPISHMRWSANLRNLDASQESVNYFSFPGKILERDFTSTFDGLSEAVFYSSAQDPFPEEDQPHLGRTDLQLTITNPAVVDPSRKVLVVITTASLFNGISFNAANLDTRSRYVLLDASNTLNFTFNYMHPGEYFVNALYDANGDLSFSSGDFINFPFDQQIELLPESETTVSLTINQEIP